MKYTALPARKPGQLATLKPQPEPAQHTADNPMRHNHRWTLRRLLNRPYTGAERVIAFTPGAAKIHLKPLALTASGKPWLQLFYFGAPQTLPAANIDLSQFGHNFGHRRHIA